MSIFILLSYLIKKAALKAAFSINNGDDSSDDGDNNDDDAQQLPGAVAEAACANVYGYVAAADAAAVAATVP
jgi:hypothetical protein